MIGKWKRKRRRTLVPERLESRVLMAADPIRVGVVYLETDHLESNEDAGSDSRADHFILSFTGGAPDTELRELVLDLDKDGDGITIGDGIFDTASGGRGSNGYHGFGVVRVDASHGDEVRVTSQVVDGGQELRLSLENFRAGDRLEFSIDVDEVLRLSDDLDFFNSRLDTIVSGQEFQDSILRARFDAPHFERAAADALFVNEYGDPADRGLTELPPNESGNPDRPPNRSAAAIGSTVQVPKPVAIEGRVWVDNDLDRRIDPGEPFLGGVGISLYRWNEASGRYEDTGHRTVTDADGEYRFGRSLGLMPGTYRVVQSQPDGYFSVAAIAGQVDGRVTGAAESVDVLAGIEIPLGDLDAVEYNFAEAAPAEVSGYVYRDDDDDGIRDAGEPGLGGVRVRSVPVDTIAAATSQVVTTDSNGYYAFDDLVPGEYELVQLDQPEGLADGRDTPGRVDGRTVGAADTPGDRIGGVMLGSGAVGIDYNFGELPLGSLGGFVFMAAPGMDCDGVYDPARDLPLSGVEIVLETAGGEVVARTTTGGDGSYRFADLLRGTYQIREITPEGLLDGGAHVGRIGTVRVGTAVGGGLIRDISLGPGADGVEYNFCEAAPATVSGTVYHDRSNDGRRDSGEEGIAGVRIDLVDRHGNRAASATTDASGRYEFDEVPAGEYALVQHQPDGYLDGIDTPGRVDGRRVGRSGADGDSLRGVVLKQGSEGVDYDFGELLAGSLSGRVHADRDGDCVWDPGEPLLQGVSVRLLDETGGEVARTTTDSQGRYRFEDLAPGRYTIVEQTPAGYFSGSAKPGSIGGVAEGTSRIGAIGLLSGQSGVNYDFCEHEPAELGGTVYVERHAAHPEGASDPIPGVLVELYDDDGRLVTQTRTDGSGDYRFAGLRPGRYQVFQHQPSGYLQGREELGSGGGEVIARDRMGVELFVGSELEDYNFYERLAAQVAGRTWVDADLDRRFEDGERPLAGIQVELVDSRGDVVATTRSDATGRYRFTGLTPGEYGVRQRQPDGLFHGGQVVGTAGGRVADDDLIVGIDLGSGRSARGYDFPEVPPAMISGVVFQDGPALVMETPPDPESLREYRDGVFRDENERIAGVTLELRTVLGQPLSSDRALPGTYSDGPIRVVTDTDGRYTFSGLRPGTYHVYQVQPEGWIDGLDTPGTGGGLAVNPADTVVAAEDEILIQTLSASEQTDPNDDAILRITVSAGDHSRENHFSEIKVEPPPATPPIAPPEASPPPETRVVAPPLAVFPTTPRVISFGTAADILPLPVYADEWAMSWHLSVINGGHPRGSGVESFEIAGVTYRSAGTDWEAESLGEGRWYVGTLDGELERDAAVEFGHHAGIALLGDFNGDGIDQPVLYRDGQWFVDLNGNGVWDPDDLWIRLGTPLDRPVVGDWDGDGKDDIGIFGRQWERDLPRIRRDPGLPDPDNRRRREVNASRATDADAVDARDGSDEVGRHERWLRRGASGALRADAVDHVFQYGRHVDVPIAGDWNGDGIDQIGVFRDGRWTLDMDGDGRLTSRDQVVDFGHPGDEPVVGDFDGDGVDEIAVVRGDVWIIDTDGDGKFTENDVQIRLPRPTPSSQPVAGDGNGDGVDTPGYYDAGTRDAGTRDAGTRDAGTRDAA